MDWLKNAQQRQDELIGNLQELVQINSVLDESTVSADAPFGKGPKEALDWMLEQGKYPLSPRIPPRTANTGLDSLPAWCKGNLRYSSHHLPSQMYG